MMKISLVLEAINRTSAPIREVIASIGRLPAAAAAAARRVGSSMMYMRDRVIDAGHQFRMLAGPDGIARAGQSIDYLKRQVSGLTSGLTIMKYAAGAAIIGLGEEFIRGVFKAGGETQQMLVTLTRLEGSAARAKQAMSWMQTFGLGAGASFSMPDIMRSYQMAKNFGMNPQGGSLAAFADLASGERVPLKQVLIAVKDAMEGTSTRPIANLGIKMKQGKGDGPNTYIYADLAGKFVTAQSAKTPEAVLATLTRIINSKYMGLATQQAQTVPGGIAQLQKLLYLFEAKVASAGVLDWALAQMNRLFAWVRKAAQNGDLDRLAKKISDFITGTSDKLIAFVAKTKWEDVARNLNAIGAALAIVAGAIKLIADLGGGGLSGLFNVWMATKIIGVTRALVGLWPVLRAGLTMLRVLGPWLAQLAPLFARLLPFITGFGEALVGIAVAIDPLAWVAIAIVGVITAGVLLVRNWSSIGRMLALIWRGLPRPIIAALSIIMPQIALFTGLVSAIRGAWGPLSKFFSRLWDGISSTFKVGTSKVWAAMPVWMRGLVGGVLGGVALGPSGAALGAQVATSAGTTPPAKHAVGGHLTIELTGKHQGARVTKLRTVNPNFGLSVKRGPVLAGG